MNFQISHESLMATTLVCLGAFLLAVYNSWKGKLLKRKENPVREDHLLLTNMLGSGIIMILVGSLLPNGYQGVSNLPAYMAKVSSIVPLWFFAFVITGPLNIAIQHANNVALKKEDTSLVTPLASATPVLLLIMSWYILNQWPTDIERFGLVLIAIGAYVLYLKGKEIKLPGLIAKIVPEPYHKFVSHYFGPWIRVAQSRGAQIALLSAYLGSISINFDALIALELNPILGPGLTITFVGLVTLGYMAFTGRMESLKADHVPWKDLFYVAVVYAIANSLMTAGYLYQLASLAGSLKRTQIFWTVLIATLYLNEPYARDRIIGSIIITIGTILITL